MPIQGTFSLKLFKETDESWEYPEAVHIRWKDFLRKNGSRYFFGHALWGQTLYTAASLHTTKVGMFEEKIDWKTDTCA